MFRFDDAAALLAKALGRADGGGYGPLLASSDALDLRRLPAPVAKAALTLLLEAWRSGARPPPGPAGLALVTGSGLRSSGLPVLPAEVCGHVWDRSGPALCGVRGNPGRVLFTEEAVLAWLAEGAEGDLAGT